jgi:hypothetical protein
MINHTDCTHEKTKAARAKCRRTHMEPWPRPPLYSLGPPPGGSKRDAVGLPASWGGKANHNPDRERNRGTTPRDRDKQCMNCGVERIGWAGTDPYTGRLLFVGERCTYLVERAPDFKAVEK